MMRRGIYFCLPHGLVGYWRALFFIPQVVIWSLCSSSNLYPRRYLRSSWSQHKIVRNRVDGRVISDLKFKYVNIVYLKERRNSHWCCWTKPQCCIYRLRIVGKANVWDKISRIPAESGGRVQKSCNDWLGRAIGSTKIWTTITRCRT